MVAKPRLVRADGHYGKLNGKVPLADVPEIFMIRRIAAENDMAPVLRKQVGVVTSAMPEPFRAVVFPRKPPAEMLNFNLLDFYPVHCSLLAPV